MRIAIIGAGVLRRFGVEYQRLAERLEKKHEVEKQVPQTPSGPTPFHDKYLGQSAYGPAMVWLPGGTFTMGDDENGKANPPTAKGPTVIDVRVDSIVPQPAPT